MKRLEEFILEKLKISKIETNYKPKNKEELVNIIIAEIEANGPDVLPEYNGYSPVCSCT